MEYNTKRESLTIPEYGRHVQKMISHALTLKDKDKQQKCVDAIIKFMGQMNPHLRDIKEFTHKLWDHLHIMSNFELDIESPYPKPEIEKLKEKPERMSYPKNKIRIQKITIRIQKIKIRIQKITIRKICKYFVLVIIYYSKSRWQSTIAFKASALAMTSLDPHFKILNLILLKIIKHCNILMHFGI